MNETADSHVFTIHFRIAGAREPDRYAAVNDVLELRRIAPEAIDGPEVAARMAALLPRELSAVG